MQTAYRVTALLGKNCKCRCFEYRLCKRQISKSNILSCSGINISESNEDERKADQSISRSPGKPSQPRRNLLNGPNLKDFFHDGNMKNYENTTDNEIIPYLQLQKYGASRKVYFDVYGCQMNVNDTEIIWSILKTNNFLKTNNLSEADIVLIITCAIRESAETKIWNKLELLKGMRNQRAKRKDKPRMIIGILGCMAERLKERVLEKEKTVDIVAGPDSYKDLPRLLALTDSNQNAVNVLLSLDETYADIMPVRLNENSVTAFVSIMRGCDNICTYCIVPFTRGRERSRPIASILSEIRHLAEQGVKEITLLGQNVNSYRDLSNSADMYIDASKQPTNLVKGFKTVYKNKVGGLRFADLLDKVAEIDPEIRIRFTSPHPKDFPDEVLQVIQERPNICKNLHLPAQSGNTSVLERMRRGYSREAYLELVEHIRQLMPNISLSSDFICGFCGETELEFQDTLSLVEIVRYNSAYIFPYSMREKTTAHRRYSDDVPHGIKHKRTEQLVNMYRHIVETLNRQKIGQLQLVLVEGRSRRSNLHLAGRNDANIKVIFPNNEVPVENSNQMKNIRPGDYVVVQINDSTSQVLKGIPLYLSSLSEFYKKNKNTYTRSNSDYLKYSSML